MAGDRVPRLRVSNESDVEVRAYVEPWGFDVAIASGGWLEFEAEAPEPDFLFEISHNGPDRHYPGAQSLSVHHRGSCRAIVVVSPDGKRDRFG